MPEGTKAQGAVVRVLRVKHYVFGYGSLQHMKDGRADARMRTSQFIGDGILRGHMLARMGPWAACVRSDVPDAYVLGEVYLVEDWEIVKLDRGERYYEFMPPERSSYLRESKQVVMRESGRVLTCFVYTSDHNPIVNREKLTHTWPVEGDMPHEVKNMRTHEPL